MRGEGEAFNVGAIRRARVPINNRCVAPTVQCLFLCGYILVAAMWEVLMEEQAEGDMLHRKMA